MVEGSHVKAPSPTAGKEMAAKEARAETGERRLLMYLSHLYRFPKMTGEHLSVVNNVSMN